MKTSIGHGFDGGAMRSMLLESLEPRVLLSATVHVSTVTDPSEDGSAGHPYDSIQEAINAAAAGDTVLVGPGTYVEDLVITTDSLELVSAGGADVTTIKGVDTQLQAGFPLADPNIDIQASGVSIHGFTMESPDVAEGHYSSGIVLTGTDIEIYGNSFVSIQAGTPQAGNDSFTNVTIQTYSSAVIPGSDIDGLTIHDNTFSGTPAKGYYGIYVNPADSADETILIERNTFSGTIWRAIVTERSNVTIHANEITTDTDRALGWANTGIRAVTWDDSEIADVTISANTVNGESAGDGFSAGISLGFGSQDFSDVIVESNFISDHTNGVLVNAGAEGITITNNDLTGNVAAAVNNADSEDLDASGNYWGVSDPADVAGQVTGGVDYTPWLVSGADAEPGDPGFQGDFTSLMVDDDSVQTGGDGRIQEGIELVSGSTVTVAEGSYTENLAIDKGVSLAASGNVDLTGKHTITDGDVSLDGFDFIPGPEGMVIVVDTEGGSIIGVSIANSTFDFTSTDGIAIWLGGPDPSGYVDEVTIQDNQFNGPASKIFNPMKIGGDFGNDDLDVQARDVTFIDNTVDRGSMPVHLKDENITNLVIESNVFTNTDGVVYVWCTTDDPTGVLSGFQFIYNDVDATNSYGVGIDLDGQNKFDDDNFGAGNAINYNTFGIIPGAYGFGAVSILAGLTAYELDATRNYWGDASGPTHADNPAGAGAPISDNVDFTPWWATATTEGAENVRTGTSSGVRAYSDTVQGAIDAAAAGDTVVISPGTYVEDLVINTDDLMIMSHYSPLDTVIKGVATLPWGSWPLASPNVDIQADGVTIQMLTFESPDVPDGQYSSGIVLSGTGITIEDCHFLMIGDGDGGGVAIQTYRDDVLGVESDISDLLVMGSTFSGTPGGGYVGIWINHTNVGAGGVTIHNNVLTGNVYQGIATERSDTTITDNTANSVMAGAGQGIYIRDFDNRDQDGVTVSDNAISGFAQGIRIGDPGGLQNLTNIDITDNHLTGNDKGVQVRASGGGVTINGNDIAGNATFGVENTDAAAVDATYNWWGSATGPTHATNPLGTGDAVSDNVLFGSFLTAPANSMPDLTIAFVSLSLLDTHVPGEKAKAVLQLTNVGNVLARGRVRLDVYASADGVLDMADVLVGTVEVRTSRLKLGVGRSYTVTLYMPANLQPGTYNLIAVADSWNNVDESNEGNNQAVSGQTFDVVWQFGTVAGTANRRLRVVNEDGQTIVFSLRGAGTGTVTHDGDGSFNVATDGSTTAATKVALTGEPGTAAYINNFAAAAEIGQFRAGGVGVLGDLDFQGGVRKVAINSLTGDGEVTIDQTANPKGKVSLSLGTVTDGSVTSAIPIQQLVVQQWVNSTDVRDVITAPYIMMLRSFGGFEADLELAGVAGVRSALSKATLGSLTDAVWNIGGNLSWLQVYGNTQGLKMSVTGIVGNMLTGSIISAEVTVTQSLRRIWGTSWLDGYLIADKLGHMLFRGGNLGADIILHNTGGAQQAADIIKTTSYIDDATIRINGSVRRVHAGAIRDSQILLGVHEGVSELPTRAEQFVMDARLGGFRIDGIYSFMSSYIDSCVAASRIAVGRLRNVSLNNGGDEFGLAAKSIGDLELIQFGTQYGWPRHWLDAPDDFVVRIV